MDQQVAELVSAIVLDPETAAIAAADAQLVADALSATPLQRLAIARAEAWRAQADRGRSPRELQPFLPDNDPVMGLTVLERTALALQLRLGLNPDDMAQVLGMKLAAAEKLVKAARRQLARSAIAMALLLNPSRCPALAQLRPADGILNRKIALALVTHAAECSICVPVMRTVDRRIVDDYRAAEAPALEGQPSGSAADLIARAQLRNGWPAGAPVEVNWLKWAGIAGAASTGLILISLLAGR